MPGSPVRVLIVDDNELFGEALKLLLERYPDDVVVIGVARDGLQAVDLALTENAKVVLMDVGLPSIDGFEAARRIRASKQVAKIIAVTGRTEAEVSDEAHASGISAYLSKDHIAETVIPMIAHVLAQPDA